MDISIKDPHPFSRWGSLANPAGVGLFVYAREACSIDTPAEEQETAGIFF
jgi:hypothetical protein